MNRQALVVGDVFTVAGRYVANPINAQEQRGRPEYERAVEALFRFIQERIASGKVIDAEYLNDPVRLRLIQQLREAR